MMTERMVNFTEKAQAEIKEAMQKNELEGYAFNLYLERNEYGGMNYGMQLTEEKQADDIEEFFDGFTSLIRKEDVPLLTGTTVDYGIQHGNEGFIIDNPNVQQQSGCGCGGHGHKHEHTDEAGCGCGGHGHKHEHTDEAGCGCGGQKHKHEHQHDSSEQGTVKTCKCGRKDGSHPDAECQCQKA
ncbi:HesB/IscA family protein [Brochothrix campestris]|nr:iron-sulfur cluster assembly accessory protein [Brochothrix campestris]